MQSKTIFIVDDHESVLTAIRAALIDEAFDIAIFGSAEELQEGLQERKPDLILLDIWLPGMDGIEALKKLKSQHPAIPVIIMSGHAGVDIAVNAMKAGASDFLEKPLNLDLLLESISRHSGSNDLNQDEILSPLPGNNLSKNSGATLTTSHELQKTLRRAAVLNGVGLLSGSPTGIIVSPMPINTGIVFSTIDGFEIPARITALEGFNKFSQNKKFTANSTVLAKNHRRIRTVEHLLAALHMMGITNASIKVNGEIPNIDGSAADFCRIITEAGIEDQNQFRQEIVIKMKIGIGDDSTNKEKYLFIEPFDGFEVLLRVEYPAPIYEQKYSFNPQKNSFIRDIAPARSFNTFENIDMAQQQGVVGSGFLNSHIIIHEGKVINTKLNFPDEFVRHKILDLLGDLYLLGHPLRGRIVGNMTSHGLNQALAIKIHEAIEPPV